MTITLNSQGFGIQNTFNGLDQCTQPRFVHIPITLDLTADNPSETEIDVDLTSFTDQKKIDVFRGLVWICKPASAFTTVADGVDIMNSSYSARMKFNNDYQQFTSCSGPNDGTELRRPIFVSNPARFTIKICATFGTLDFVFMDIYLTNFEVEPHDGRIEYPPFV